MKLQKLYTERHSTVKHQKTILLRQQDSQTDLSTQHKPCPDPSWLSLKQFSQFTKAAACMRTSSLPRLNDTPRTESHASSIRSSVDGHLSCFHSLVITNKAAMNIHAHVFVWTYAFILLEKIFGMK